MKNRTLIILGAAESVSAIGDWITMMAVFALLVFRGNGGIMQSSGIFLAGLLPTLPASLAAGWLCDRFDRKNLMIGSLILSGVVISGLIFTENLVWIYTLLAIQAVTVSLMTPARSSVLPDILPKEELTRANAFLQQLSSLVKIGAPILAGGVLAILNPHQAIILDVVSFFLAAGMLWRFLPKLPPYKATSAQTVVVDSNRDKATGIRSILVQAPGLKLVFSTVFFCILVLISFDVLCAIYFRDVLKTGEQYMGLAIGLIGAGTLFATILLMRKPLGRNPWRDVVTGIILLGIIPLSLATGTVIHNIAFLRWLVLAACTLGGIGNGLVNVQMATLLQTLTPQGLLGRVSGLFQSTAVSGQIIGILVTPLLVPGLVSMSGFFLFAAVGLGILVLFLGIQLKRAVPMPKSAIL